eukprot:gene3555-4001_t
MERCPEGKECRTFRNEVQCFGKGDQPQEPSWPQGPRDPREPTNPRDPTDPEPPITDCNRGPDGECERVLRCDSDQIVCPEDTECVTFDGTASCRMKAPSRCSDGQARECDGRCFLERNEARCERWTDPVPECNKDAQGFCENPEEECHFERDDIRKCDAGEAPVTDLRCNAPTCRPGRPDELPEDQKCKDPETLPLCTVGNADAVFDGDGCRTCKRPQEQNPANPDECDDAAFDACMDKVPVCPDGVEPVWEDGHCCPTCKRPGRNEDKDTDRCLPGGGLPSAVTCLTRTRECEPREVPQVLADSCCPSCREVPRCEDQCPETAVCMKDIAVCGEIGDDNKVVIEIHPLPEARPEVWELLRQIIEGIMELLKLLGEQPPGGNAKARAAQNEETVAQLQRHSNDMSKALISEAVDRFCDRNLDGRQDRCKLHKGRSQDVRANIDFARTQKVNDDWVARNPGSQRPNKLVLELGVPQRPEATLEAGGTTRPDGGQAKARPQQTDDTAAVVQFIQDALNDSDAGEGLMAAPTADAPASRPPFAPVSQDSNSNSSTIFAIIAGVMCCLCLVIIAIAAAVVVLKRDSGSDHSEMGDDEMGDYQEHEDEGDCSPGFQATDAPTHFGTHQQAEW